MSSSFSPLAYRMTRAGTIVYSSCVCTTAVVVRVVKSTYMGSRKAMYTISYRSMIPCWYNNTKIPQYMTDTRRNFVSYEYLPRVDRTWSNLRTWSILQPTAGTRATRAIISHQVFSMAASRTLQAKLVIIKALCGGFVVTRYRGGSQCPIL